MIFGDDEPEDAYDAGDALEHKLANLVRRAALLPGARTVLTERDRLRLHHLEEDLRSVLVEVIGWPNRG